MKYEEIYKILEKHELERFYEDNKMIPRYNYPRLINELLTAINYTRCCMSEAEQLPNNKIDIINRVIKGCEKNNESLETLVGKIWNKGVLHGIDLANGTKK